MQISKDDINTISQKATSRWGNWAKYLIGAIIGALVAGGVLTVTGCGTSVSVVSDQGMLEISPQGVIIYTPPINDSKK